MKDKRCSQCKDADSISNQLRSRISRMSARIHMLEAALRDVKRNHASRLSKWALVTIDEALEAKS